MSTEENKAIARRYNEGIWRGEEALFDEILAPNCTIHGVGGPQEIKATIADFRRAVPDAALTVEEMIAEDDKVVVRWTIRGTLQGEFWGAAPQGQQLTYTGITIHRFVDGKIVDDRFEGDIYGLWQQLHGAPPTAQPHA